jgi:NDP-sugar pyrophosphorylase family protein
VGRQAIILAGGEGRRLYPYTLVLPKPLVPIGKYPIIEIVVRQLAAHGFDRVTIAVGYHADLIMAVMGDGRKWGIQIEYSLEERPLNTIGPLKLMKQLDQSFLVMNGDLLTDLNFRELYDMHLENKTIATIASCKRHVRMPLGVLSYQKQENGPFLTSFIEKPEFDYDVSMGVYVFDPEILRYIPDEQPFGFDQLMLRLLAEQRKVAVYEFTGHWLDMGSPDDLDRAVEEFTSHQERYLPHD